MSDSTGPGHGGKNNFDMGAGGGGRWERTEVVKINNYFRATNPNWVDVGDSKGTTVNQNLYNIVYNTNLVSSYNEITLSHHLNAFNQVATGTEVWYYAGDEAMRRKAARLSSIIANTLGIVDRGPKATTSLYVVSNTNAHCLLIEWYFVDNANDRKAWDKNGTAAMKAAMKELGMKTQSTPKPAPKPTGIIKPGHSVIIGTFDKNSSGHKACVALLKSKGMKYTEYFRKDKVFVRALFNRKSTWKQELERAVEAKNWAYVVVLQGQENAIIDNWNKYI